MLAEIAPFQALLDAIGWLLAWLYDVTGNFGFAIIILTIVFRIVLLPLGIKQIKSMQAMQALQPKIKEIQKKFKGNKQKVQEQTMKLYQEYGVQSARRVPPTPASVPDPDCDVRGDQSSRPLRRDRSRQTGRGRLRRAGRERLASSRLQGQPPPCGLAAIHRHHAARRRSHALPLHEPAVLAVTVREDGPCAEHAEEPSGATLDCGDGIPTVSRTSRC